MTGVSTNRQPLRLFTFSPGWGLPTTGPFGLKLEMCLRMLEIPFERVYEDNIRKGPKRKSPWIEDAGIRLGDTELILAHLERTRGVALDRALDPTTHARAHALRRMLEEHFHQVFEYELFVRDEGFAVALEQLPSMPWPLAKIVPPIVRRAMTKHLFERGIARHSPDEITAMGRADVDALVAALGDRPWLFGDAPTKTDAAAFGLLAVAIKSQLPTPVCRYVQSQPTLVAYVDRALARLFGE